MQPTNHAQTEMYRNPDWRAGYDERYAPVPGWGVNPNLAGPRMVGIGQASAAPGSYGAGSAILGLAMQAGIGVLAMAATRHFAHRDASGATYGWAAAAGVGGAIVGSLGGLAVCAATAPTGQSTTPTSGDVSAIGGWLGKCVLALVIGTTAGSIAGGVLVGRKQGR